MADFSEEGHATSCLLHVKCLQLYQAALFNSTYSSEICILSMNSLDEKNK